MLSAPSTGIFDPCQCSIRVRFLPRTKTRRDLPQLRFVSPKVHEARKEGVLACLGKDIAQQI